MNNDYQIFFEAHNQKHTIYIDLECFANALKPYLVQPKEEKKCHCLCHVQGYHSNCSSCSFNHLPTAPEEKKECGPGIVKNGIYECACIKQPSAPTNDLEEEIRKIWVGCTMEEGIKRLLALARKTK